MAYIKRLIIGAFLLLGISSAFAVTYEYYIDPALPDPLPFGACAKFVSSRQSSYRFQSPASVYIVEGAEYENRCKLLNSANKESYPERPDLWYPTVLGISRRVKPDPPPGELDSSCPNLFPSGKVMPFSVVQGYVYSVNSDAMYFDSKGNKYSTPIPMSSFQINIPSSICSPEKCSFHISSGQDKATAYGIKQSSGLIQAVADFSYISDGLTCSAADVDNKTPVTPGTSQPPGCDGAVGTINGVTTCVPKSTNGTTGPATPASGAASGSSTGSTGGTATTPAGTASGAATPASGPASSPSTSKFGGSCAATSCDGDALQCAIAQEQAKRNCALFDATSEESAAYAAAKAKAGTNVLSSNPNNSTVDLSKAFDTSDALAGGHCISDVTVTVMNRVVTLPFTKVCPYLQILGNILVAVSMLMAAGIMVRG